eukprot:6007184-Alexandrium_andersonii.AAC.1
MPEVPVARQMCQSWFWGEGAVACSVRRGGMRLTGLQPSASAQNRVRRGSARSRSEHTQSVFQAAQSA